MSGLNTQQPSEKNQYLLGYASTQQHRLAPEGVLPVHPDRAHQPFGVVMVDAAADISSTMAAHPRLRLLPLALRAPGRTLMDKGARGRLRHLGRERLRGMRIEAPELEALEYRIYPSLAINADRLIYIGSHHALIDPAPVLQAVLARHAAEIRDMRRERGLPEEFELDCVDGGSVLSGPALQARVLLEMLESGRSPASVAQQAASLRQNTTQWLVPSHPRDVRDALLGLQQPALRPWVDACAGPLRNLWSPYPVLQLDSEGLHSPWRAKTWNAAVATLFQHVADILENPVRPGSRLQISFDGSLKELQSWPVFTRLREQAVRLKVALHLTHMSPAGRVWASSGSLSLALWRPEPAPGAPV